MEIIIEEGEIKGAIDPVNILQTKTILKQMENSVCKITSNKSGTGFFCNIELNQKIIPVLITNYHIINDEFLESGKTINIQIRNEYKRLKLDRNRKVFSSNNRKYDIMILEIYERDDFKDINYLEFDEHLFQNNSEYAYENSSIYILHYPGNEVRASYGYGISIKDEKKNKYDIKHKCNTSNGSSGSPILNLRTNKVIGIHKAFININDKDTKEDCYNMGTLLKYPLLDLKENNLKNAVKKPKPINHYNSSLFVKNPTPVIKLPTKNTENKNEIKELINPHKESNDQRNKAINNNNNYLQRLHQKKWSNMTINSNFRREHNKIQEKMNTTLDEKLNKSEKKIPTFTEKKEKVNSNNTDEQQKPLNYKFQNFVKITNKRNSFVEFKTRAENEKGIPKELINERIIDYPNNNDICQTDINLDLRKYNGHKIKYQNINQNYNKKIEKKINIPLKEKQNTIEEEIPILNINDELRKINLEIPIKKNIYNNKDNNIHNNILSKSLEYSDRINNILFPKFITKKDNNEKISLDNSRNRINKYYNNNTYRNRNSSTRRIRTKKYLNLKNEGINNYPKYRYFIGEFGNINQNNQNRFNHIPSTPNINNSSRQKIFERYNTNILKYIN